MTFCRVCVLFFLFLMPQLSCATGVNLQAYHNARVVYHSQADVDEYVLALGSLKKTKESWSAELEVRLSGNLERFTLELPDNHSADSGFDFYIEQLKVFNYRELFHCSGRDCGTSNSWANNYFKIPLLYGLDQYQQYGVYEINSAGLNSYYAVIYSVLRGNRRVFMQVELLAANKKYEEVVAASSEAINNSLLTNGYYVFPASFVRNQQFRTKVDISRSDLSVLVELLKKHPDLRLALVGHDYSASSLEQQQKSSLEYAARLKLDLVEAGIAEVRLEVFGMGSLAPAGRVRNAARVEVVKL